MSLSLFHFIYSFSFHCVILPKVTNSHTLSGNEMRAAEDWMGDSIQIGEGIYTGRTDADESAATTVASPSPFR